MTNYILSPSSAERWMNCTGSIVEIQKLKDNDPNFIEQQTSKYAEHGKLFHEYAYLKAYTEHPYKMDEESIAAYHRIAEIEKIYPNTDWEAIRYFIHFMTLDLGRYFLEKQLKYTILDNVILQGTSDLACYSQVVNRGDNGYGLHELKLIDYKFGSQKVELKNNSQLKLYQFLLLNELNITDDILIKRYIFSPFLPNKKDHVQYEYEIINAGLFRKQIEQELLIIANNIVGSKTQLVPSERNCQYCPAKATCPATKNICTDIVNKAKDFENNNNFIDNEYINDIIKNKALVLKYIKAVEDYAFYNLTNERTILGLKLVQGRGKRVYTDNAEIVLADLLKDQAYEKKLLPLTKIEKLVDKEVINSITVRQDGALQVALSDDPREAANIGFGVVDDTKITDDDF